MAVVIEVYAPEGLTLTANLFPYGSDTAAETGVALSERGNAKGVYTGELDDAAAAVGWHNIQVLESGEVLAAGSIYLTGTEIVHRYTDYIGVQDPAASLPTRSQLAATAAALLSASWGSGTTANTGLSRDRILEAIAGVVVAQVSGADTDTNEFKHLNTGLDNITVIVDAGGNRSSITIH